MEKSYEKMNVKDLKEKVKERGCVGYSSLKKQELINVLKSENCGHLEKKKSLPKKAAKQPSPKHDYEKMNVKDLKEKVKERGCVGYSSLKKQELIDILKSEDCGHLKKKEPNKQPIKIQSPIKKKQSLQIQNPNPIQSKTSESLSDIDVNIRKKFTSKPKKKSFRGQVPNIYNITLYFTWLYGKNNCIILDYRDIPEEELTYNIDNGNLSYYLTFFNDIKKCYNDGKYRFIIIPFSIVGAGGHHTVLIYDKKLKEMEWFDPNGITYFPYPYFSKYEKTDKVITKLFNENIDENMIQKFYNPLDFCPIGLQHLQHNEKEMVKDKDPEGFCTSWSFWFIELRLSNPNLSREKLLKYATSNLVNNKEKSLTKFIRGYSVFLDIIVEGFKSYRKQNSNISQKDYVMNYVENRIN